MYIINSVDKTKLSSYTPQPTQHHSFFRNLPPLVFKMYGLGCKNYPQ